MWENDKKKNGKFSGIKKCAKKNSTNNIRAFRIKKEKLNKFLKLFKHFSIFYLNFEMIFIFFLILYFCYVYISMWKYFLFNFPGSIILIFSSSFIKWTERKKNENFLNIYILYKNNLHFCVFNIARIWLVCFPVYVFPFSWAWE